MEEQYDIEEEERRKRRLATPNAGIETIVVADPDDDNEKKDIISAFTKMFGSKPGYKPPTRNAEGHIIFSFPEKGDAEDFFLSEAQNGRRMMIVDAETNTVVGYSTGDGTLYHADGRPFEKGQTLEPSKIPYKEFTIPSAGNSPRI